MIPNVVHGDDMPGLVRYLVSTSDTVEAKTGNRHVDPHIVGGDDYLCDEYQGRVLDHADSKQIAAYLEGPRAVFGTDIRRAVKEYDPDTGRKHITGWTSENVWHCSLSLAPTDQLDDHGQWAHIAHQFMDSMGFTEASGRAPARWVAIHHGPGKGGQDHVHIAASMIREDGTKWAGRWSDWPDSQRACRQLEKQYGLQQVSGRELGIRERGDQPAERATAARLGLDQTIPRILGQRLRAAAGAARTEDEFVRNARRSGLVVKPVYERGGGVRSYQAGLHPDELQEYADRAGVARVSRWASIRSATKLGPDLELDRLRADLWGPPGQAAQTEWDAAYHGRPPAGEELWPAQAVSNVEAAADAAQLWSQWHDQLVATPPGDRHQWAAVARDVAGAMQAYAPFSQQPARIRQAADSLARTAKTVTQPPPDQAPARHGDGQVWSPLAATAWLGLLHHNQDTRQPGQVTGQLIEQMVRTTIAVADWYHTRKHTTEAARIRARVVQPLQAEQTRLANPHLHTSHTRSQQASRAGHPGQRAEPDSQPGHHTGHDRGRAGNEPGTTQGPAETTRPDPAVGEIAEVSELIIQSTTAFSRKEHHDKISHTQLINQLSPQARKAYETKQAQRASWLADRSEWFDGWWDQTSSFTRAHLYEACLGAAVAEPDRLGLTARILAAQIEHRAGLAPVRDNLADRVDRRRDRFEAATSQTIGATEDARRMQPLLDTAAMRARMGQAQTWAREFHHEPGAGQLTIYRAWLACRNAPTDGDPNLAWNSRKRLRQIDARLAAGGVDQQARQAHLLSRSTMPAPPEQMIRQARNQPPEQTRRARPEQPRHNRDRGHGHGR